MKTILFLLLCLAFACKKKEDSKKPLGNSSSAKFSASTLAAPSGVKSIDKTEIQARIESAAILYLATDATATEESGENTACTAVFDAVKVNAKGNSINVDQRLDLKSCRQKERDSNKTPGVGQETIKTATSSIYVELTCAGKDYSAYNGKTVGDIPEDQIVCDGEGTALFNNSDEDEGVYKIGDKETTVKSSFLSATSTANNSACTISKSGNLLEKNGCQEIFIINSQTEASDIRYEKKIARNLKWAPSKKSTWYTSGTIDVTMNDWTGTVTFTGPETDPTYVMKKGADTVQGTLSRNALGLTGGKRPKQKDPAASLRKRFGL